MKKIFSILLLATILLSRQVQAQVAINTNAALPDNSAMLDVSSNAKGVLIPRMSQSDRDNNITSPATGLIIFQTDNTPGLYYWDGTAWVYITDHKETVKEINDLVDAKSDKDGSEDYSSVFVGWQAGNSDDSSDNKNAALGYQALYSNTDGSENVGIGYSALYRNTSGAQNVAVGLEAGLYNTSGGGNTAIGYKAYYENYGLYNTTCIGYLSGRQGQANNRIEIGNTSITWIGGQVAWSTYSDARIKTHIQNDVPGIDFIKLLRPVTYNLDIHKMNKMTQRGHKGVSPDWPGKYDIEKMKISGFIAQEVAQAAKQSGYDFSGVQQVKDDVGLYSLSYAQFVVPLVKATQEQQTEIESLKAQIKLLQKQIAALKAQK